MSQVYHSFNQHAYLLGHLVTEDIVDEVNRMIADATAASVFVESQSGIDDEMTDDDCDSSEDDNDDDEDDGNDELEIIAMLLEEEVNSDTNNN